jgi:hypothetical protein
MLSFLLSFFGMTCPACGHGLGQDDLGHVCQCGVVVDVHTGSWRYASEWQGRPLSGLAGLAYRREVE